MSLVAGIPACTAELRGHIGHAGPSRCRAMPVLLPPDGTIEAVRVATAPGWAFGVQWHPEWHYAGNADSMAIFRAFGAACRAYATGRRKAA